MMKYTNNSSFNEVFRDLMEDAGISVNDEINIKNSLSDHESELEHDVSVTIYDAHQINLNRIDENIRKTREQLLILIDKQKDESITDKDLDLILRLLNGIQL